MARPPDRTLTPDEEALWHSVMGESDPPAQPEREPPPAKKTQPPQAKGATAKPPHAMRETKPEVQVVRGRGSVAGLDKLNAQRLRRCQMTIEARLDLHGMTQGPAHSALSRFLVHGTQAGRRCVLVITGKGTPREEAPDAGFMPDRSLGVLRSEVPRWLAEPGAQAHVVAWAPAIPRDGGDGALYVLLRRKR